MTKRKNGVRYSRHPWADWFEKRKFTILRGRDYACRTSSMNVMLRNAATQRDLKLRVSHLDDRDGLSVVVREDGDA